MKFNFSYEPGLMEFVLSTFEITATMLVSRAISYDLEMKTREQAETTNKRKYSDLIGLSNGYKCACLLDARVKKRLARRTF